jgi:hypothetical protein
MVTYPIFGQEVQVELADYELPPLKVVEIIPYGQTPNSPARGYCWQPRAKGRCGSVSWTGSRLRRTRVGRRLTPQPPWKVRSRPRSSSSADHGRVRGTWACLSCLPLFDARHRFRHPLPARVLWTCASCSPRRCTPAASLRRLRAHWEVCSRAKPARQVAASLKSCAEPTARPTSPSGGVRSLPRTPRYAQIGP